MITRSVQDELKALNAELEDFRRAWAILNESDLRGRNLTATEVASAFAGLLTSTRAERDALRKALIEFGAHHDPCSQSRPSDLCTCGLDAIVGGPTR